MTGSAPSVFIGSDNSMQPTSIAIVTPVLNDWESFSQLVRHIAGLEALRGASVTIVAVDDGSTEIAAPPRAMLTDCVEQIHIIKLKANQGHQRAIVLGLAYVEKELSPDRIVVMDSDGEDRPEVIPALLAESAQNPGAIIVAQRKKRSEGLIFRAGYQVYKFAFRYLTGKPISFGNFSLIPANRLPNVIYNSGIWNNFAATLLKSRLPIRFVPTERGLRYHGSSKMNVTSLMIHGFSAISVFTDVVIGRIISLLTLAVAATAVGISVVVYLKFFGGVFVPGYATTVILFMVTVLALCLFNGFLLILSLLATRESSSAVPSDLLDTLIQDVSVLERVKVETVEMR
ncbi:MAG: glycosyltransferase [Hyphomonas sp.]